MLTVTRYHDISCGHRVVGHEGKCRLLHGHNYRITFTAVGEQDATDGIGRVVDFSVIKDRLCAWLEQEWDHKMLLWDSDPALRTLRSCWFDEIEESLVAVPFNPTAENLADYLLRKIAPTVMKDTGARIIAVRVDETRKCSAVADLLPDERAALDEPALDEPALTSDDAVAYHQKRAQELFGSTNTDDIPF